jgi:polyferredoxin
MENIGMMFMRRENPQYILKLYYVAFGIILGIFVLGYVGISFLQNQYGDAESLINIAGRQRMLSQRISF